MKKSPCHFSVSLKNWKGPVLLQSIKKLGWFNDSHTLSYIFTCYLVHWFYPEVLEHSGFLLHLWCAEDFDKLCSWCPALTYSTTVLRRKPVEEKSNDTHKEYFHVFRRAVTLHDHHLSFDFLSHMPVILCCPSPFSRPTAISSTYLYRN